MKVEEEELVEQTMKTEGGRKKEGERRGGKKM